MKIIDTETAIIGGGASGLAAAIAASRYGCGNVTVLEKMQRVGKKYFQPVTADATSPTAIYLLRIIPVIRSFYHTSAPILTMRRISFLRSGLSAVRMITAEYIPTAMPQPLCLTLSDLPLILPASEQYATLRYLK